jgi:hypothetical protein
MYHKRFIILLLLAISGFPAAAFAQTNTTAIAPLGRDPATTAALQKSQKQLMDINKGCIQQAQSEKGANSRGKIMECMCAHAEDIAKANKAKTDAFAAFANQAPQPKQRSGTQVAPGGAVAHHPTIPTDAASVRTQYNCK